MVVIVFLFNVRNLSIYHLSFLFLSNSAVRTAVSAFLKADQLFRRAEVVVGLPVDLH